MFVIKTYDWNFRQTSLILMMVRCSNDCIDQSIATIMAKEKNMKPVFTLFKALFESIERREWQRREAYLAASTDLYDLEYRLRKLDQQDQLKPAWMSGTGA
jgi:hypothetical protein